MTYLHKVDTLSDQFAAILNAALRSIVVAGVAKGCRADGGAKICVVDECADGLLDLNVAGQHVSPCFDSTGGVRVCLPLVC